MSSSRKTVEPAAAVVTVAPAALTQRPRNAFAAAAEQFTVPVAMFVSPGVPLSVTCRRMVFAPAGAVQVNDVVGLADGATSNVPLLSRSHAYEMMAPPGSVLAAPVTVIAGPPIVPL